MLNEPRIESAPGNELREAWIYLSDDEARHLLASLLEWEAGDDDPEWHLHIGEPPGAEVTVAVGRRSSDS